MSLSEGCSDELSWLTWLTSSSSISWPSGWPWVLLRPDLGWPAGMGWPLGLSCCRCPSVALSPIAARGSRSTTRSSATAVFIKLPNHSPRPSSPMATLTMPAMPSKSTSPASIKELRVLRVLAPAVRVSRR